MKETIRSITVLKDEGAVSRFGAKGENGVIRIDIKKTGTARQISLEREMAGELGLQLFEVLWPGLHVSRVAIFSFQLDLAHLLGVLQEFRGENKTVQPLVLAVDDVL